MTLPVTPSEVALDPSGTRVLAATDDGVVVLHPGRTGRARLADHFRAAREQVQGCTSTGSPDPFATGIVGAGAGGVLIVGSVDEGGIISSFSNRAGTFAGAARLNGWWKGPKGSPLV